jgi:PTH1 family peptidyl-tRNA hydrolase
MSYSFFMTYIIAGLGNPGEEYENTRHNTGRIVLDAVRAEFGDDFEYNKKLNAQVATGKIGPFSAKATKGKKEEKLIFVAPDTFMNNSGKAIGPLVKTKMDKKLKIKTATDLIVIYDDFNLPLGKIRISYNRSSGGHNGLESIIKAVKTEAFVRIRVGVAPEKTDGTAKTPHGDDKIEKFILGKFKDEEMKELKKVSKNVVAAVETIVKEGREKAMTMFNGM